MSEGVGPVGGSLIEWKPGEFHLSCSRFWWMRDANKVYASEFLEDDLKMLQGHMSGIIIKAVILIIINNILYLKILDNIALIIIT